MWLDSEIMAECTKCGLRMHNLEPWHPGGEFYHGRKRGVLKPQKARRYEQCPNHGKVLSLRDRGVRLIVPKQRRREIARGAKQARKYRPRG